MESIDVQPFLAQVCDQMHVGELLCSSDFSLHDAMLAIEIGDAKMDVGLRREGTDTRSVQQLISAGHAPTNLSIETQLAVMDRLMCMEVTWHKGVMLSQTVFTSLYVLDKQLQVHHMCTDMPLLYGAALGIRSTCTLLHDAMMSGQVVDDEDMLMHIFGFTLDLPGSKGVKKAAEALEAAIQKSKEIGSLEIVSRLKFRLKLLQILELMHPATEKSIGAVANACKSACSTLEACLQSALPEETLAAAPGFAPDVHRRATGLAPPRAVHVVSFKQAIEHWTVTLQTLGDACRWLAKTSSWRELRNNLVIFAAIPNNLPVTRSLVHRALVSPIRKASNDPRESSERGGSTATPPWCPDRSMIAQEFGWSPQSPPSPDADMFLEQCAIAVQGWCHAMCLNRCRQRRRLRRLLDDWVNMLDHAFNAENSEGVQKWFAEHSWRWKPATDPDGVPYGGPITAWVEREASATMAAHLMHGAQLDLYSPTEFCFIYWYCDYLFGASQVAFEELAGMKPEAMHGKHASAKSTPSLCSVPKELMVATALMSKIERMMCQAMMRMCLSLTWLRLITTPPGAVFNTEQERYNQRFDSFMRINRPPPLSYEDYKRSTDPGNITPQQLLLGAFEALAQAQTTIATLEQSNAVTRSYLPSEYSKHMSGIRKIAAQNMLAIKLLITSITGPKAVDSPPFCAGWDFKVAIEHCISSFYPSIVLKSDKKAS